MKRRNCLKNGLMETKRAMQQQLQIVFKGVLRQIEL